MEISIQKATVTKIGKSWFATFINKNNYQENVPINLNLDENFLGKEIGIIVENNKLKSIHPWK